MPVVVRTILFHIKTKSGVKIRLISDQSGIGRYEGTCSPAERVVTHTMVSTASY